MADDSVVLHGDLAAAQAAVAALGLDVLHYPDIGMSSFSYFLAYARLAPVQTVGWGHPVTTGLDSIDYFLTFDAAEPADCAAHYSEIPVRFRRPPAYYEPFALPAEIPARAAFGLPAEGALYACPQSLFKFHPDFDGVLAAIAALDPSGWIVALDGANPGWKEALRQRWARCHPVLLERVVFLPFQPLDRFMMLLTLSDVMLDPVHFGGGRLAAGLYRLLDIADAPVAATIADYAGLAVAIAGDRQRRETLRGELLRKGSSLCRDEAAVGEFAAFLAAAVDAAAAGRKLTDWRPPDEAGLSLHDVYHTTAGGP